jgi:hypothetical protein
VYLLYYLAFDKLPITIYTIYYDFGTANGKLIYK